MRILYISSPSFADCDFPLIREYQRKGIDVTYLMLLPPFSLKSTLFDIKNQIPNTSIFKATEYKEFKIYETYMDMSKVYIANRTGYNALSLSYWKHKYDLFHFINTGNFDIIHSDIINVPGIKFLRKFVKQWIQTIHDPFPHTGESTPRKTKTYKRVLYHSNYIVLLNKKQKDDFCDTYNINPDRVFINRLGVYDNIKSFVKPSINIKKNNILFFGRISPYKGIEYLCEAFKKVKEQIPDATLTIAGGGKMYFDIEPYRSLGYIDFRNRYIGMQELAILLSSCEFSVCPYTDATQSGVVMTSFSLGKPVIATKVGGLPEMIEDGKTGILVPPQNSEELANAMIALLKNKERLHKMSAYISENYHEGENAWSYIADKYINLYSSII